jgi:hypothetical protein
MPERPAKARGTARRMIRPAAVNRHTTRHAPIMRVGRGDHGPPNTPFMLRNPPYEASLRHAPKPLGNQPDSWIFSTEHALSTPTNQETGNGVFSKLAIRPDRLARRRVGRCGRWSAGRAWSAEIRPRCLVKQRPGSAYHARGAASVPAAKPPTMAHHPPQASARLPSPDTTRRTA